MLPCKQTKLLISVLLFAIRDEYETKLDESNSALQDVHSKQDDINAYIDATAENKIAKEREKYKKNKSDNDKALRRHKAEYDR